MNFKFHNKMLMNQQAISVSLKPYLKDYLKRHFNISEVHFHTPNIYLLNLPVEGEIQELSLNYRKFIFQEELSLLETQHEITLEFNNLNFDLFFSIQWHGVIYYLDKE